MGVDSRYAMQACAHFILPKELCQQEPAVINKELGYVYWQGIGAPLLHYTVDGNTRILTEFS